MPRKSLIKRALAGVLAGAVALTLATGANAETVDAPIDETLMTTPGASDVTPEPTPEAEVLELPSPTVTPAQTVEPDSATVEAETVGPESVDEFIPNESIPLEDVLADMPLNLDSMALPAGAKPVYRFWSPRFHGHHFTISEAEKANIERTWPDDWDYEQVAYYAFEKQAPGTVPVYRFWSEKHKGHFFTISEAEVKEMGERWPGVWESEGIAFYVYPSNSNASGAAEISRFWSNRYGKHFYTSSTFERDKVIRTWPDVWSYEGSRFKAIPTAEKSVQERIVDTTIQYLGYPYAWAGAHPSTGFDCSGYIKWVVQQATGKTLYHGATQQAAAMTRIPASQAVPGDFWFRGSPGSYGHVGVYMGNNRIAHSPDYGRLTSIQTIWTSGDFYRFNG